MERGAPVRGPRSLLRQIREGLAGGGPSQARLDRVVRIIASSMVAEVCSLYLRRAAGDMELFATEGLKPEAVHVTRMKPGEGLVGEIMRAGRPINLSDAPTNPHFSYHPETGEDPYHSFLGVPLLRGGRAIGVLVVQNRTARVYDEDEVEDLQTIAMVLAEMVAMGEVIDPGEFKGVELAPHRPERLKGLRFADGLAIGVAVLHETPVAPEKLLADDSGRELVRLEQGVARLRRQIDDMLDGSHGLVGQTFEVLEAYRMFAHSRSWNRNLEDAVRSGLTAEAAVERVRSEQRVQMSQTRDAYLRERLHDLEDLADRLLRILAGEAPGARDLPEGAVLIARNLGPRRPSRIRPHPPGGSAAGGGVERQPCLHRGAGPGHPLRRAAAGAARPGQRRRSGDRGRRDRRGPAAAPVPMWSRPSRPAPRCATSAAPSSTVCATPPPSPATAAR